MYKYLLIFFLTITITSCKEDILPKPKAYLSLKYPEKTFNSFNANYPYTFEIASSTNIIKQPNYWLKITYPKLKASIDITYRPVNGNLKELLTEAEKLVFEHTIKADQISSNTYENKNKKVYGSIYEITGNSASNVQFHVTDSSKNFLKGSLFFYSKPNYDSIIPAVDYIKQDMIHLIETLKWR